MNERHLCPDCNNEFVQPFRCITCGAQRLYDNTLRLAEQRAERAESELAAARALLTEALSAITDHAIQRTFAGGVVLSNTAIKIRAALAAPESSP